MLLVSHYVFSGQVDLDDLPVLIQDTQSELIILLFREVLGEGAGESLFFSHPQYLPTPHLGFSLGGGWRSCSLLRHCSEAGEYHMFKVSTTRFIFLTAPSNGCGYNRVTPA